jgi:AcrR family transcriptional regulator
MSRFDNFTQQSNEEAADRLAGPATAERPRRSQDPEGVRRDILAAASDEFAEKGLSGARVDEIAARTATSKRMIYYYFGDKRGLYIAVLEAAYIGIRAIERSLDLDAMEPGQALATLAGATFDYHADHPGFVRLVMVENIHHARHLETSRRIGALNLSAIDTVREICRRGLAAGVFRPDIDPLDVHLTISALAFYNVSNRASIRQIFGHDMGEDEARARRRRSVIETVLKAVAA